MNAAVLYLEKNGEIVAKHRNAKSVSSWNSLTATLIYKENNKTENDDSYKLCFKAYDKVKSTKLEESFFQWGYKIRGSKYNLIEHRFEYDPIEQQFEVIGSPSTQKVMAGVFDNDDCTGDVYSFELEDGEDEIRIEGRYFENAGWKDKARSALVPVGYELVLESNEKCLVREDVGERPQGPISCYNTD